jgi:hypothetical protein
MSAYFPMVDPTLPSMKKDGELIVTHTMSRLCVCVHAHVERSQYAKSSEGTSPIKIVQSVEGTRNDSPPFETSKCVLIVANHGLQ